MLTTLARRLFRRPAWSVSHEEAVLAALTRPGDAVYDVGANDGSLAAFAFARRGAAVYAFEPVPGPYLKLCRKAKLAGAGSVTPFPFAVADAPGTRPLWVPAHSDQEASFAAAGGTRVDCPCVTLDGVRAAYRLPPPAVLKLDVEGAEPLVLRGAGGTLDARPVVFAEVFAPWLARLGLAPWDALGPLAARGYSFLFLVPGTGLTPFVPSESRPFPPGFEAGYNVLAHLPEHAARVAAAAARPVGPTDPPPVPNTSEHQ